jgi:type I restriction enzyme S subunit
MLNLNTDILGAVPVMLPTLGEQREIDAALSSIDVRLLTTRGTLDAMSRVKSALMSVLLTGEVRVTPDPEPSP